MARTKKPKSATGTKRANPSPKNVEVYSDQVPENARDAFAHLRATIRSAVPADAEETISYGIPAFARDGIIVWFAAFSDHCSLFPTASVIEAFRDELQKFSTSKGTIHFALDRPLPTTLIKRIVKARVQEKASGKLK
jgi:uncharacterized protein YdhG (YjbR/CyaY superfamily)